MKSQTSSARAIARSSKATRVSWQEELPAASRYRRASALEAQARRA